MIDIRRDFPARSGSTVAVDGISLSVGAGQIVCVLGPNGAGKTTTVKMAATLLEPTSGQVRVMGVDAVKNPREARRHLGLVLGGDRGFYMRASAVENLRFFADLQGVKHRDRDGRIKELLQTVGLSARSRDSVESFSRGMKQRLHLARALLSNPQLVLLDEPSIGLDPEGARDLRVLVLALRAAGHGVLLTTHYLHEADELADELVVIDEGSVAARGTGEDIAAAAGVTGVTSFKTQRLRDQTLASLRQIRGVRHVFAEHRRGLHNVDIVWSSADRSESAVLRLVDSGMVADSLSTREATLEEAYLAFLEMRRANAIEKSASLS